MRPTLSLIVLLVVLFGGLQVTFAQFDEICHYECANVYCDPYTDYCDYDCYEVCYPFRTLTHSRIQPTKLGVKMSSKLRNKPTASQQPATRSAQQHGTTATTHRNVADGNKVAANNSNGRTGKGVHMRIQRVPRLNQDASTQTREFQRPENFALLDTCLSDRN